MKLYTSPEMSPTDFEVFVAAMFGEAGTQVDGYRVEHQAKIEAHDGSYTFDATITFELGGMTFLVLVEAKMHTHPITRDVVSILHNKVQSVGAHKGVVVSTTPFQHPRLMRAVAQGPQR